MNNKIISFIAGGMIGAVAHAQAPKQALAPNQLFPSAIVNVHSPNSDGWVITGSAANGISFGKKGTQSEETYGAQLVVFDMPAVMNNAEFVTFVKNRIAATNAPPRYREMSASYQYGEERGYPCVRADIVLDDMAAVTSAGIRQLTLQVISLYCHHPVKQEIGFFAAFSHRGKSVDDQLEAAAKSFIDGVKVPSR